MSSSIPVPELGTPEPDGQLPPLSEPLPQQPMSGNVSEPSKRPRSRRRTMPPPQQPVEPAQPVQPLSPQEFTAISKAIGMGWRVLFQILAQRRGEHWLISPEDEKMLGDAYTDAAAPWLAASAKYAPIAGAVLLTVGVVVPRVQQDAELVAALGERKEPLPTQALEVMQ